MVAKIKVALLWDMDYLIFSAMSASEVEEDWGDDIWHLSCDHNQARSILFSGLRTLTDDIESQLYSGWPNLKGRVEFVNVAVVSGGNNFRLNVLESYKGNRKGKRKPVGYPAFVEGILDHFGEMGLKWEGVEGDDTIGILMTNPSLVGCDRSIGISCDKDFNTVPGYFYWMTHKRLQKNTEEHADRYHMYQTLIGDTTDGYSGVPGMGAESATKFLDDTHMLVRTTKVLARGPRKGQEVVEWVREDAPEASLWECMVSLAESKGLTEEDLLVQARVARILRWTDWDHESKKPILWTP